MKSMLLCLFITFLTYSATAQNKINVDANQGGDIEKAFSRDVKMLFPEFKGALVYLKGSRTQALMNLNILSGKLMFVDKNNDTLALANEQDVVLVAFDDRKFIPTFKGFVEMIANAEDTILGLKTSLHHVGNKKYGAYGMQANTSAIDNINTVETSYVKHGDINTLAKAGFDKKKLFYIVIGKRCQIANQGAFLKVFAKKKNQIKEYLQQNSVDFSKEEDLVRLFNFCITNKNP
ncbi:MAG: hypothetical protein LBH91_05085 [Prevotellaceae bacterium]|jgi:hypothetical protein|nr:hypothetical protein [Prevotellaceae bacterium]